MAGESILPPADDGNPTPTPAPTPAPPPARGELAVCCEFCESRITRAKGEVLELGKRARKLRDLEIETEQLKRRLRELEEENARLKAPAETAPKARREW